MNGYSMVKYLLKSAIIVIILITYISPSFSQVPRKNATEYEINHTSWIYPPWKHSWVVLARQTHLTFFTLGKAEFINPQGLDAVRLDAWDDTTTTGDDDELCVYGINNGENSIIYNKSMRSIGLYGYDETGDAALNNPWDVAATEDGLVFVTDSGNQRVVKLRNIYGELVYDSEFGYPESENEASRLVLPRGIDIAHGGWVLVADAGSGRVVRYDTSGVFINAVEGFDRPVALASCGVSDNYFHRPWISYFVVCDSGGQRLQKYDFTGKKLSSVSIPASIGIDESYTGHIELEFFHNVVVTDSLNHCLHKFDRDLNYLVSWGEKGKGRGMFTSPTGITVWRKYGQVFIAEKWGAQYLWTGLDVLDEPDLQVEHNLLTLGIKTSDSAKILMKIENDSTVSSRKIYFRYSGYNDYKWNYNFVPMKRRLSGDDPDNNRPVPVLPGRYNLILDLESPYWYTAKYFDLRMTTEIEVPAKEK